MAASSNATTAPFVRQMYERLLAIVASREIPPAVAENAAIALGRLGLRFASELAPQLPKFAPVLLEVLGPVETTAEKGQALLGLNHLVALNPAAMGECLGGYMQAAADVSHSRTRVEGLKESFQQVSGCTRCRRD